jgi:DNA-binding GntR family transcriptional regulator
MALNRSEPLYNQIYAVLWERIVDGSILPGTRLSDLEWSENLNVSRTPVREAMRKLQQDGVLVALDRGGYEVRRMTAQDLQSLYRCRAALESLAVREALPNLSKRQLDKLEALIVQTEEAIERKAFAQVLKLNTKFHETIVKSSSNFYLENLLTGLGRMILFARSSLMVAANDPKLADSYSKHLRHGQSDHRRIIELLRVGDVEAAATQMQQHLSETGDDMGQMSPHQHGQAHRGAYSAR